VTVSNRDPKRYYALLNVAPTATEVEIRLSYRFLKQAHKEGKKIQDIGGIREAYATLVDPDLRAAYDGTTNRRSAPRRMNSGWLALGVAVVFAITISMVFGSQLMAPFISFDPGDNLYWKATKQPIGLVLEYEQAHEFTEGPTEAAYRIKLSSGDVQWFGAADLHLNGARR
jgi:curved DNA-binding protein CbpA